MRNRETEEPSICKMMIINKNTLNPKPSILNATPFCVRLIFGMRDHLFKDTTQFLKMDGRSGELELGLAGDVLQQQRHLPGHAVPVEVPLPRGVVVFGHLPLEDADGLVEGSL